MAAVTIAPFLEDTARAVKANLDANLSASLLLVAAKYAAVDAAENMTVPLTPPSDIKLSRQDAGAQFSENIVTVYAPSATLVQLALLDADTGQAEYEIGVVIQTLLSADLEDTVERIYMRFSEAILGALLADQSLGGLAIAVYPRRVSENKHSNSNTLRLATWELGVRVQTGY